MRILRTSDSTRLLDVVYPLRFSSPRRQRRERGSWCMGLGGLVAPWYPGVRPNDSNSFFIVVGVPVYCGRMRLKRGTMKLRGLWSHLWPCRLGFDSGSPPPHRLHAYIFYCLIMFWHCTFVLFHVASFTYSLFFSTFFLYYFRLRWPFFGF